MWSQYASNDTYIFASRWHSSSTINLETNEKLQFNEKIHTNESKNEKITINEKSMNRVTFPMGTPHHTHRRRNHPSFDYNPWRPM